MRIAVDARELCGRPTGVGRYLGGLLDAWARQEAATRHEWTLYAHARPAALPARWAGHLRVIEGAGGTSWEQFALRRAINSDRPDVLFAPGYTAPLSVSVPLVLTVHDVSFFAHREWFTLREGTRRRTLTAWSARRARRVITDSQFSRAEIVAHIGIDDARIRVIPLGVDAFDSTRPVSAAAREPMVLYVGSVFARRRVDRLIEAFDLVADRVPSATLQIAGENRTSHPRLDLDALRQRCRHADRIHIRSYVDDQTLASLYERASVLAFLSEYEGFGFTPLEALAAGVAPVLLDTPIAREICGPAAAFVSPAASNPEIAGTIADLLANESRRHEIVQNGQAVLAQYNWNVTAAATLTILEEAAIGR